MKTSKEILEEGTPAQVQIPIHGNYQLYRYEIVNPGPRIVEGWLGAEEFRNLAILARRKAAELLAAADSMDAWMLEHTK